MTTLSEKFDHWAIYANAEDGEQRRAFQNTFYYGASSALVTMIKGNAPQTLDVRKIHFTVLEMDGYRAMKQGKGKWQAPADDTRETTLEKEWLIGDEPKTERHQDLFYGGAHSVLAIIVDEDSYRVDVRKIPVLVEEVDTFFEENPRETKDD